MDRLEAIMYKQAELQRRLGTNFSEMDLRERAEFMRNHRGYLADEVAEALYEMPFYKLWKNYLTMTEEEVAIAWQKVRMELIDSLHFFVNLLLCAGMNAEEVYEMYMAKNKENHRRQDDGYTADKSYRDQSVDEVLKDVPTCVVDMDGETHRSTDFVAVMTDSDGEVTMYYNTDVITLGQTIQMLASRFEELMNELPEDTRAEVMEVLRHE